MCPTCILKKNDTHCESDTRIVAGCRLSSTTATSEPFFHGISYFVRLGRNVCVVLCVCDISVVFASDIKMCVLAVVVHRSPQLRLRLSAISAAFRLIRNNKRKNNTRGLAMGAARAEAACGFAHAAADNHIVFAFGASVRAAHSVY